ncbi:MAG: hypothetical protein AAGA18_06240 [Verrucomicrobiota bacterium]
MRTLTTSEQKKKIEQEVDELIQESSKPAEAANTKRTDLKRDIYLAEDLAMREIEQEFEVKTNRQVAFGSMDAGIDGMFAKNGKGYGIEVKFVCNTLSRNVINQAAGIGNQLFERYGWKNFDMIIAVVLDNQNPVEVQKQRNQIQELVNEKGDGYHCRVYEYGELLKKCGIDKNGYRSFKVYRRIRRR